MRIIRKLFIIISISVIVIVTLLLLVSYIWGDTISAYLVNKLNENINTKVEVSKMHFSLLKRFPNASIEFKNVTVFSSNNYQHHISDTLPNELLKSKYIILEFNILDLINKRVTLNEIGLKNARIQFLRNAKGQANYDILKHDTAKSLFSFDLKKLKIVESSIIYIDKKELLVMDQNVSKLIINGSLNNKIISGDVYAKMVFNKLSLHNVIYLKNKSLEASIKVKYENECISFQSDPITLSNIKLKANGSYTIKSKYLVLKYQVKSQQLEDLVSLYEPFRSDLSKNIRLKGEYSSYGIMQWNLNKAFPSFTVMSKFNNVSLHDIKNDFQLQNISADVVMNMSTISPSTAYLQIKSFDTYSDSLTLNCSGIIKNYIHPVIDVKANLKGQANAINKFFKGSVQFKGGTFDLHVACKGDIDKTRPFEENNFFDWLYKGTATVSDANVLFVKANQNISDINTDIEFDKDILFNKLSFTIDSNTFNFNGNLTNYAESFKTMSNFYVNGNLSSKSVIIKQSGSSDDNFLIPLFKPNFITLSLNLDIAYLNIFNQDFNNVIGSLNKDENTFELNKAKLEYLSGLGYIEQARLSYIDNHFTLSAISKLSKTSIKDLFRAYDNFGQNTLTYKNIDGSLSGNFNFYSEYSNTFVFLPDKMMLEADFEISNGKLVNFEPLESLSKFIEISELKNVKFSNLKNSISIKNSLITIPLMDVRSSACDFSVFGTHNFDNEYEYHIKIMFSELMQKKYAASIEKNNEFANVQPDEESKKNLYLKIAGKNLDYKISYDRKEAINNIKQDLKKEKETLKGILREEFGFFKKDTIHNAQDNKKNNNKLYFEMIDSDQDTVKPVKKPVNQNQKPKVEWEDE
jgi:hypothetical protein